jgi:hypothetical protein
MAFLFGTNWSKLVIHDEDRNQFIFKPLAKQLCENLVNTRKSPEQLLDLDYQTTQAGSEGLVKDLFKSFKIG